MKRVGCILALSLASLIPACADDPTITLPDLVQGAQQWAQENLDTNVLNSLPQIDDPQVQKFLRDIQPQFQGDYVVDLAALRQTAQAVLPILESEDDTQ